MKKIILTLLFSVLLFANQELLLNSANSYIMVYRANKDAPFSELLSQAKAVIILSDVKKIGFLFGGMSGTGVMVVDPNSPNLEVLKVDISGGSLGFQAGYENSALVIFVMNESMVFDIKDAKLTIKADANFAFGDLSGGYKTIKDFKFSKDFYLYSTNSGFFAGASFGGAIIKSEGKKFKGNGYPYNQLIQSLHKF